MAQTCIALNSLDSSINYHILDIDECDEKSDKCSKNATCIDTKGSYKCQCKHGFHGDGYNCTGIPLFYLSA